MENFFTQYINILQFILTFQLFYKYLTFYIKNKKFNKKVVHYESEIQFLSEHYVIKDVFTNNIISMIDSNDCLAMQIKDEHDRYILANKALRKLLFNDIPFAQIKGKTDPEILHQSTITSNEIFISNLKPSDLKNISLDLLSKNNGICNLTDIITKSFNIPCRFFETVGDLMLDVYKSPMFDHNQMLIGTSGSLINITDKKETKLKELQELIKEGNAFKIGNTDNYYIIRDKCYFFDNC